MLLYMTTFWFKVADPFWRNGQVAAYFSVSLYSRHPDDTFLVRHEWMSATQTYLSLAIEASVPWLLWKKRLRPVGVFAGLTLHACVAATAKIALFSFCMLVPYLAFLDRDDIDLLVRPRRA
jgi:hypothetical protein